MLNVVKIYNNVSDMQGIGEEWLVVNDEVLAVFVNGCFKQAPQTGNTDITLAA